MLIKEESSMRFLLFLLLITIISCNKEKDTTPAAMTASLPPSSNELGPLHQKKTTPDGEITGEWKYRENTDKMRGVTNKMAMIISSNGYTLGNSPKPVHLALFFGAINDSKANVAMFYILNNQFNCNRPCKVTMKFGNHKLSEHAASVEGDANDRLSIYYHLWDTEDDFFVLLKKNKSFIIEVDIYREGVKQFEFAYDEPPKIEFVKRQKL